MSPDSLRSYRAPATPARLLLLLEARRNLLRAMARAARRYGDLVPLHWGAGRVFLLVHPDHVRHVLEDGADIYRNPPASPLRRALLGKGLAMIEGERWRRDRELMMPAFHRERLAVMTGEMVAATAAMLDRWRARASRGETVDLVEESQRLTMDIALRTLLGQDLQGEGGDFGRAWYAVTDRMRRGRLATLARKLTGRRDDEELRAALATLDALADRTVEAHRQHGDDAGDVLSMLLKARDGSGQGLSDREARDELKNLFFGAYDTTTTTLIWSWVLLCRHPQEDERMREELGSVLGERPPVFADSPRLVVTREVVQETLRLYPPAWLYGRGATADSELEGHAIPRGSTLLLFPYLTHRHPEFWERPGEFDPGRFSPARSAGRSKYAYLPFGRGPRLCIGSNLSLLEAQVVLAMTAQAFRMRLLTQPPSPERAGTVRPERAVHVQLLPAAR